MPTVSVIIPTFKHRDFVLVTLQSVFAQTFSDFEVIVVNDGSPDDTAEILAPLVKSGRIRYFEQPNAGQPAARNRGLAAARGDFISFLDDDDLWPTDKLRWQVEMLNREPRLGAVGGGLTLIDEDGLDAGRAEQFDGLVTTERLFQGNPFWSPGQTMIRADVIRGFGGLDRSIWGTDDWDLWFRIAESSSLRSVPQIALHYRLHPGNAGRDMQRMFDNSLRVIKARLQRVPARKRRALEREGYRFLFQYAGRPLLHALRSDILRLRVGSSARAAMRLSSLIRPTLVDPRLLKMVCRELISA